MEWFNNHSPGFMCVGRNSHQFGNDRDTIFCGFKSKLCRAQIIEGKDRPSQRGAKQHQELGKAVGMMLRMFKPIFGSGKAVVFDSLFCVSKGAI